MNLKRKIVYEVYIKSFYDHHNDGLGDFKGVISKLDYLKFININVIWITPFYKSPMKDEGYDVSDYYKVNPLFGNEEDVQTLITECKKRGIDVMVDFVLNHTSNKHKWFLKALSGNKKYQDYYFFYDQPQTQWISRFGQSCWKFVPKINKYYLHLYDSSQPDLNWENDEVREEMFQVVDFWLKKGIQGFKLDVLYLISKPVKTWKPNKRIPCVEAVRDGKNVHKYIKELMGKIKNKYPNSYSVGEMSFSTLKECIKYSLPSNNEVDAVQTGQINNMFKNDSIFNVASPDIAIYIRNLKKWISKMHESKSYICNFTENHDSSRTINKFGSQKFPAESAKAHIMNIAFLWGIPFFLQGQEIGMQNSKYDSLKDYVDIKSIHARREARKKRISRKDILNMIYLKGRDSGRTPMVWDKTQNGGWSKNGKPWRKTTEKQIFESNVEDQLINKNSILHFFKEVNLKRQNELILIEGDIKFLRFRNKYVLGYTRSWQSEKRLFLFNFSDSPSKVRPNIAISHILFSNYQIEESINMKQITLKPWEATMYLVNS